MHVSGDMQKLILGPDLPEDGVLVCSNGMKLRANKIMVIEDKKRGSKVHIQMKKFRTEQLTKV